VFGNQGKIQIHLYKNRENKIESWTEINKWFGYKFMVWKNWIDGLSKLLASRAIPKVEQVARPIGLHNLSIADAVYKRCRKIVTLVKGGHSEITHANK
jgi:hypothetical protein